MEVLTETSFNPKQQFHNLEKRRHGQFYYGDGGQCNVSFNVAVCLALPLASVHQTDLKRHIRDIAARRQDVQSNQVVEDVVDPDLYPRIIPEDERVLQADPTYMDSVKSTLMNCCYRGSYCWLPAEVAITSGRARFLSPINNLPKTKRNEKMYGCLEGLLTAMLPGFCSVLRVTSLSNMQVVVKIQRYLVPPGASYSGQWHTEGVTEDIQAVGVYYVEWPATLKGGELKFRLTDLPDYSYGDQRKGCSVAIPMKEGSAIVFSNELPHRFKELKNPTAGPIHRAFVNFFVMSGKPSTATTPTNADIYLSLFPRLNRDVIAIVLEYTAFTPKAHYEASNLRALAKAEMVANKGKWGYMHHGNCGTIHWLNGGNNFGAPEEYAPCLDYENSLRRCEENYRVNVASHANSSSRAGSLIED